MYWTYLNFWTTIFINWCLHRCLHRLLPRVHRYYERLLVHSMIQMLLVFITIFFLSTNTKFLFKFDSYWRIGFNQQMVFINLQLSISRNATKLGRSFSKFISALPGAFNRILSRKYLVSDYYNEYKEK